MNNFNKFQKRNSRSLYFETETQTAYFPHEHPSNSAFTADILQIFYVQPLFHTVSQCLEAISRTSIILQTRKFFFRNLDI